MDAAVIPNVVVHGQFTNSQLKGNTMEWIHGLIRSMIASAVLITPLLFIVLPVALMKKRWRRSKNPLTQNMRRPAGTELARKLKYERDELYTPLAYLSMVTPFLIAYYFVLVSWFNFTDSLAFRLSLIGMWLVIVIYYTRTVVRRLSYIHKLRLGYECELAVGQELDQLMLNGFRVFHDIPTSKFNIDHIVIGRTGVFAIETKGRSKPRSQKNASTFEYKVRYDGKSLTFPSWSETKPIQQATSQAKWVSDWLSKATALPINARPVLVLPGWWISRVAPMGSVDVLQGKNMQGYFLKQKAIFSDEQIQRIAHQVDQKVRDLAPGEILDSA